MSAIELNQLRPLHRTMRESQRFRCMFPFRRGAVTLQVFFVTDTQPYLLMFARVGVPAYFEIDVHPGYRVDGVLESDKYHRLCKMLGLVFNSQNPFRPADFFLDLNAIVPSHVERTHEVPPQGLAPFYGDRLEHPDRKYFKKWLSHPDPEINDVSDKNLEKTKCLMGEVAFRRCRDWRISSVWTADERYADGHWNLPSSPHPP